MKNIVILLVISFLYLEAQAQSTGIQGLKIKDNKLYIKKEEGQFRVFTRPENFAGSEQLTGVKRFSLMGYECGVYMEWQNPLRYQLKWADSTFKDENDMIVQEYAAKVATMFGAQVADLNKDNAASKIAIAKYQLQPGKKATDLNFPPDGFKSADITFLYLFLRQVSPALTPTDISAINSLESDLGTLDKLIAAPTTSQADALFIKLHSIGSAKQLANDLPSIRTEITNFESQSFKPAEESATRLSGALASLSLEDKLTEVVYKSRLTEFINKSIAVLAENRELIQKFEPIVKVMENSVSIPGDVPNIYAGATTEYYKVRNIAIEDGKGLHTGVTLLEKEYNPATHEYKVKSEIKKGDMQFRRFDPVTVFLSAGAFWGTTRFESFGWIRK